MKLYIAEKPSLAKAIAAGIGKSVQKKGYLECENGDLVTWCYGHMMEQAEPEGYGEEYKFPWKMNVLPIVPTRWLVSPVAPRKEGGTKESNDWARQVNEHFHGVERLIRDGKVTEIVHAGDPDREGQLIVDEILDYVGNKKPVRRLWLKALDPGTIRKAIAEMDDNSKPLYRGLKASSLSRSRADWLVGMNMSRAVSILAWNQGGKGVMPVGRVQTPIVKLVADRNALIAAFRPQDFFVPKISVAASGQGPTVELFWKERAIPNVTDEDRRILDRKVAEGIASPTLGMTVTLAVKNERKEKSPPLPWTLSTLQVYAGKKLGISPRDVDEAVQSLYDAGHVSYPRTECPYLPTTLHATASEILGKLSGLLSLGEGQVDPKRRSASFDDSKVEAHYGIVPTVLVPTSFESPRERAIYDMIARVFAAQFAAPLVLAESSISTTIGEDVFSISGKSILSKGWFDIWAEGGPKSGSTLPSLPDGTKGTVTATGVREGKTTPPDPFTETSIIEVMKSVHKYIENKEMKSLLKENDGIGTVATRSQIVEGLIRRGLLAKGKEKDPVLRVTEKGRDLLSVVPEEVADPVLTAMWERSLGEISHAPERAEAFVKEVGERVSRWIESLRSSGPSTRLSSSEPSEVCPDCGHPLYRRTGQYGPFWAHAREAEGTCGKYFNDRDGKPVAKVEKTSVRTGLPCPRCSGNPLMAVYQTSSTGREYFECGVCRSRYWSEDGGAGLGSIWDSKKSSPGGGSKSSTSNGKPPVRTKTKR